MNVGRVPTVEDFFALQRFLESRLRAQEARGEAPNLLADPEARTAMARAELVGKRPTLYVPLAYAKRR